MCNIASSQPSNFVRKRKCMMWWDRWPNNPSLNRNESTPTEYAATSQFKIIQVCSSNNCKHLRLAFLVFLVSIPRLLVLPILDSSAQLGLKVISSQ